MTEFTSRLTTLFEVALSVLGAGLLVIQTLSGADGLAAIGAALVALIAPVCSAIRASQGGSVGDVVEAVSDAVTDTLDPAA
ncbi:MAG: hypothetical protein AAGK23_00550 [Pseudomonadota bacterium]